MAGSSSIQRYGYIDALRGAAVMGVVLVHSSQYIQPQHNIFKSISAHGQFGVQLFFIASALTLFLSLESRSKVEDNPVRNFFIRRFFRIAPMFYIGILLNLVLDGLSARYWAPNGISGWTIALTFGFLNGWHPEMINSLVPGGWSIAVEFTFYLLMPFLFSKLKDIKTSILFIISTILLGIALNSLAVRLLSPLYPEDQQYLVTYFVYMWFFSQLPIFGIGALLYNTIKRLGHIKDQLLGWTLFFVSMYLFIAFLGSYSYKDILPKHVYYGFAFFILAFSLHCAKIPLVDNPVIQWIGKLSFSIYILHFSILKGLSILMNKIHPVSGDAGTVILFIIALAATCGASFVTYSFIEKPGISLGKKLIQYLETRAPQPVPDQQG